MGHGDNSDDDESKVDGSKVNMNIIDESKVDTGHDTILSLRSPTIQSQPTRFSNVRQITRMEKLRRIESHLGLVSKSCIPNNTTRHLRTPAVSSYPLYNTTPHIQRHSVQRRVSLSRQSAEDYDFLIKRDVDDDKNKDNTVVSVIDIDNHIAAKTNEVHFRRETFWKSCCCDRVIDKRATQYFVQVGIGVSIMIFCMYKIAIAPTRVCDTEDDTTVFIALISSLVGWFLPSPQFT